MQYIEVLLTIEPAIPGHEIAISQLAELGFDSFWEDKAGLRAYISESMYTPNLERQIGLFDIPHFSIQVHKEVLPDVNWNAQWEAQFQPIEVKGLVRVRAPFHEASKGFQQEVVIEPQMSFGTGHHQTTWMMLKSLFELDLNGKRLLDMGSGTGILAILARKLGAGEVWAIDIDAWAYDNAMHNCTLNGGVDIRVEKGDVRLIEGQAFDVILANINRNVLLRDLDHYSKSLSTGGHLLLSGFFVADVPMFTHALLPEQWSLKNQHSRESWALLHFQKR